MVELKLFHKILIVIAALFIFSKLSKFKFLKRASNVVKSNSWYIPPQTQPATHHVLPVNKPEVREVIRYVQVPVAAPTKIVTPPPVKDPVAQWAESMKSPVEQHIMSKDDIYASYGSGSYYSPEESSYDTIHIDDDTYRRICG
jgi:hypothetical protein